MVFEYDERLKRVTVVDLVEGSMVEQRRKVGRGGGRAAWLTRGAKLGGGRGGDEGGGGGGGTRGEGERAHAGEMG